MTRQSKRPALRRGSTRAGELIARPELHLDMLLNTGEFLESTDVGVVLQDNDGVVLDCNETAANFFGVAVHLLVGRTLLDPEWGAVQADGSPYSASNRPEMITLREGTTTHGTVVGFDVAARARTWVKVTTCPATLNGAPIGVISSYIDITSLVQREHAMRLMRAVNRFAMTTSNKTELLQHLCDEIVSLGDYALAWIGETSSSHAGVVNICFAAGKTAYLYDDIVSSLASKESGLGPTGVALRTGDTQIANDLKHQRHYKRWCSRATAFGLSSSIAVPFHLDGRSVVISIYDRHPFAFDEATRQGIEEVAHEIENGVAYQHSLVETQVAHDETSAVMGSLSESEVSRGQSEQRFRLAFEDNMAPMIFSDLDDLTIAVNDAFCEMVGFSREEIVGRDSAQFTHPDDINVARSTHRRLLSTRENQIRFVRRYVRKDGRIVTSEVSRSAALDDAGAILYFVSSERDITEERELASELSHQAFHDPLTGLANRVLMEDRLAQVCARATRGGGLVALLMIDLDDFKGVNDTYGHLVGDQLLVGVARRFESVSRPSDTLCRFGGDEFLYLAEGLSAVTDAEEVAARFLEVLIEPFSFNGMEFEQHASVGVVIGDADTSKNFALMQNADVALFEAKRRRKGSYVLFETDMHSLAVTRFTLSQELRNSLQSNELSMQYQPIVNLATQTVVGFEALMRWNSLGRGRIDPDVFIPIAEQSDIILELGAFALRAATKEASSWARVGAAGDAPYVSINLAANQLLDHGFITLIEEVLRESGLAPERLVLEITESTALVDIDETMIVLQQLRDIGVYVALDDFGTGYSSLSYLLRLNPKVIKIDQSFISPANDSVQGELLLEAIISLGQQLHVTLLAEGIETRRQLRKLIRLGCDVGQGFLFSRALAASDVPGALANGTFSAALGSGVFARSRFASSSRTPHSRRRGPRIAP
jgi:diguanylate cyclase (GGDEF)-like protein/PAS domain S-box-containing protein